MLGTGAPFSGSGAREATELALEVLNIFSDSYYLIFYGDGEGESSSSLEGFLYAALRPSNLFMVTSPT